MQCPKCKNQIPDNVLRCPHCNLKVKIMCPECKTISPMGVKYCTECGFEFFKECPECKTINLATAKTCRKCNFSFEQKNSVYTQNQNNSDNGLIEEPKQNYKEEISEEMTEQNINTEEELPENKEDERKENQEKIEILSEKLSLEESKNEVNTGDEKYYVSSDNVEISENQLQEIIEKVEKKEKEEFQKAEAEALIQKKFEQQQKNDEDIEEEIPQEYIQLNQQEAKDAITAAIQNPTKRVISLNGKEGYGKSLVLKYVYDNFRKNENYIFAFGECNALTQITPFGYIQDVLLNICNLSNFSVNIEEFVKNNAKAMEAKFFNLSQDEIQDLFNFLYPFKTAEFNGILSRKKNTINILKKTIENLTIKATLVFMIDDFENIDGSSFSFIEDVLSDAKFNDKVKVVITNKYNKIAQGYFVDCQELKQNNYSNIFLSGLDKSQCVDLINNLFGGNIDIPKEIGNQIWENSKGASAYVEQVCQLFGEMGAIIINQEQKFEFNHDYDEYVIPHNTYKILEERINILEKTYPILVKCLYYASILGNKFSIKQFESISQIINIESDKFVQICEYLERQNYIYKYSDNYYAFQNTIIWHYIYEKAKTDENFVEYSKNIYFLIEGLTLSNNSLKPLLLQNCGNKKGAYYFWGKNADLASYIGDTNLHVISLKQQLKLANDIPDIITAQEKIQIYERMGKILYKQSPKEAINYLSAAIAYYKDDVNNNPARIIELSAFLVNACNKTGDYISVVEACDTAILALPQGEYDIEKALMASKKLKALLHLGNCEEVINLANTELIPMIEEALVKSNLSNIVSDDNIFDIWFDISINLAAAYALQGNKKVFEVLSRIEDSLVQNHIYDETKIRKFLLIKALNFTMRGEIKSSSNVLKEITSKHLSECNDKVFILRLDLIDIINKIISKDYKNIVDEMYQLTTFADNINDGFSKNLLKLLLGYILQTKSHNPGKALEIYNEEIVFFSKHKIAIGALLSWYFISQISIDAKGVDFALDIALKALDVAKCPKINNLNFIIALKNLIGQMYMIKNDFEATKMYLEKAMLIAQSNNLKFMQMVLYQSFAKYNSKMMDIYKENAEAFAHAAFDMYNNSVKIAQSLLLTTYETNYKKELTSFNISCQLKNINLDFGAED